MRRIPQILLTIYTLLFIWSFYNPYDFNVWIVEAITSLITVLILVILYIRNIQFTNTAYILASIFPIMHIIGAHYTFALVPFDWFNSLIDSERNMYDRLAHFSVGLYSYIIIESFIKYKLANRNWVAYTYSIFLIMAIAAVYEIFEWLYAVSADPSAGIAILGSQGDIWDAQKDMLMDTLGAVSGFVLFILFYNKSKKIISVLKTNKNKIEI